MFNALLSLFSAAPGCSKGFLGLKPWYHYLQTNPAPDCSIKDFTLLKAGEASDLPLILLAVVDDLLRIAGLIAVIFVIYGGILYATSQGSPDKASRAQYTIINAVAGLAVAIVAVAFVSFLGNRLS